MATTTDDMTISFKIADGNETDPIPLRDFEEHVDRLTRNAQLSFDVGGQKPSNIKLGIGGSVAVDRQLLKGETVVIHILDEDGEIIVHASGTVNAIAFKDKTDKDGFVTTTREQKIAFDA